MAQSSQSSFQRLVDDVRRGDEDAVRQIVDEFTVPLIDMARKQIGQQLARRVEAEDIVQSVYRSLFCRMRSGQYVFGNCTSLWKLLVTITLNKVRRKAKYHRAGRRDVRREEAMLPQVSDTSAEVAGEPTAADTLALIDELQHLLAGVAPRDRAIVELRLQGCTTREIAEQTGRAERSVRRVLQHLTERWERLARE